MKTPTLSVLIAVLALSISCKQEPLTGKKLKSHEGHEKGAAGLCMHMHEKAQKLEVAMAERMLRDSGLVNLADSLPDILVDLRYSGVNNIAGMDMYGKVSNAYVHPDLIPALRKALSLLRDTLPGHTLLVYDAARPLHVQQIIWDSTRMPLAHKVKYLSNPKSHSIHNYGAAVDLTITGQNGEPLDMGTPYDHFGPEAQPEKEAQMLAKGTLTKEQVANRRLLRKIMNEAGFRTFPYEWWHFNFCSREMARKKYKLIP